MPEISVIVPCYKAEDTLAKCVHSLTAQTFHDLEIILVNDSSPDSTGDLCNKLKSEDPRITVVHLKKNSGPSAARNAGIDVAVGTWIAFVDSDDYIEPETYSVASEYAKKHSAELVIWSYCSEYGDNVKEKHIYDGDRVFTSDASEQLFTDILGPVGERLMYPEKLHSLSSVCNKLFKRSIIEKHNIRFSDMSKIGPEDLHFSAQYSKACTEKTAVYIDRCFYHYVKSNGNSVSTSYNPKYIETLEFSNNALTELVSNMPSEEKFKTAIINRRALSLINIGLNEMGNPGGIAAAWKRLSDVIRDSKYHNAFRQLDFVFLPAKWKIFFFCASKKLTLPVFLMFGIMSALISKKD